MQGGDTGRRSKSKIVELPCENAALVKTVGRRVGLYLLLNAPRSANRASTPVKASKMPPRDLQPSVPLRTK